MSNTSDVLTIANKSFSSRLFTGTGKFSCNEEMYTALDVSGTELVTLALKRVNFVEQQDNIYAVLKRNSRISLLPNTSGAKNAEEAVQAAKLAREALGTHWIKLEIHPDNKYLMPDATETLKAAAILCDLGFVVMPYVHADPVLCKRLAEVGCAAVMPLGAPIGSNQGLQTERFLQIIIEQATVPVIIDAGIGAPSHAAKAMELGADGVLVNTAIAVANQPANMAQAFKLGVESGRQGYLAGLGASSNSSATASSPLTSFLS